MKEYDSFLDAVLQRYKADPKEWEYQRSKLFLEDRLKVDQLLQEARLKHRLDICFTIYRWSLRVCILIVLLLPVEVLILRLIFNIIGI